jgi:hypothetical protein
MAKSKSKSITQTSSSIRSQSNPMLNARLAPLSNRGLPLTTAILIAYELLRPRINSTDDLSFFADEQDKEKDVELQFPLEWGIAKALGDLAGVMLMRIAEKAPVGLMRNEPNDDLPGCAEGGREPKCEPGRDWPDRK